jgi:hypothetical protein
VATRPGKPCNQGNVREKIYIREIMEFSGNFEECQGNFVWCHFPLLYISSNVSGFPFPVYL